MEEDQKQEELNGSTPEEQEDQSSEDDDIDSLLAAALASDEKTETKQEEKKDYYKKVGTFTFKTEEEYDKWAMKNYGEVSRLSGELKKATEIVNSKESTPEEKKEAQLDINALRWQIKSEDFMEKYPDAKNYRDLMAAFLRNGKAKDENGNPSLMKAYALCLRAEGREIPTKQANNQSNQKRIMQSGGGNNSGYSQSYSTKDDLNDDFANMAVTRRI